MAFPSQNNEGMSVPAFGDWDRKAPGTTNYSMLFSQARANRKQLKLDVDTSKNHANMFCPEPGGSGEKAAGAINNSMPSLRGRAHRKQRKTDGRCSLGNEQDIVDDASSPYQQGINNNNDRVVRKKWMTIPQFGGWDQKAPGSTTNYSMVFSQARAIRKQRISHVFRSLGNEQELVAARRQHDHQDSSTSKFPLAHASIPQFGGWDRIAPGSADYTMVFSKARAKRKQQKIDTWRSLGNRQDFDAASLPNQQPYRQDSVSKRRKILAYFTCCIRPR